MPASNQDYWLKKLDRNVDRDNFVRTQLESLGWQYCIIWECELDKGIADIQRELRDLMKKKMAESIPSLKRPKDKD